MNWIAGIDKSSLHILGNLKYRYVRLLLRSPTVVVFQKRILNSHYSFWGSLYHYSMTFEVRYEWYQKAIERGFKPDSYDNELRSVYMRCSKKIQKELKIDLLGKGYSYSWLAS